MLRFLKEILPNKQKLGHETMLLTKECSLAIQNKLSTKFNHPGGISISFLIENVCINHTLCNLESSKSLIPFSMCNNLDLGEKMPATISLQLAYHYVKYIVAILENIPIIL